MNRLDEACSTLMKTECWNFTIQVSKEVYFFQSKMSTTFSKNYEHSLGDY